MPNSDSKEKLKVPTVQFTKRKFKEFRKEYKHHKKAGKSGMDTFWFEDYEFLMDYAKYLVQYLEAEFKFQDGRGKKNGEDTLTQGDL